MLTYTKLEKFYPNIKIFILFVFSMHNPKSEFLGCDIVWFMLVVGLNDEMKKLACIG
jgi:hypothetical protein